MSMEPLFRPRSVAFVGAGSDPQRYNGRVLQYALGSGFEGVIHAVNPKYDELFGIPCHPDLDSIPGPVDVVVLLVGAQRIPAALEACRHKGVRFAIALGDLVERDATDRDARLQALRQCISAGGPRIVGPVCVGVVVPHNRLWMTMCSGVLGGPVPAGNIGFISQSGGVMASVMDRAHDFGAGFSGLVSSGSEFDLGVCDFLEYFLDDTATRCVSIYAEQLDDARRFFQLADRAMDLGKPILMLKGGRSRVGARVALTHSGALATDTAVEAAACRRHGVVLVDDLDDLFKTAHVLAGNRVDPRRGVAVVSQSGGYCAIVADALERAGVPIAEPGERTRARILRETPVPQVGNPHDSGSGPPGNNAPNTRATLLAFQDAPEVGATLYAETMYMYQKEGAPLQADVARAARKPHLVCWQGGRVTREVVGALRGDGVTVFDDLTGTVAALRGLYEYARMAHTPRPPIPVLEACATPLPANGGILDTHTARALLARHGVALVDERAAPDPQHAARLAAEIGFPVVLKGVCDGVAHKSEHALVALDLHTGADVADAGALMLGNDGVAIDGFVVQAQISGVELFAGVSVDPALGAGVVLGLGGVFVEAIDRSVVEMAPIDLAAANRMIDELDTKDILGGYRTGRPLHREALAELLVALGRLAFEHGDRIASIDLNPVIVTEEGAWAVDWVVALNTKEARPREWRANHETEHEA